MAIVESVSTGALLERERQQAQLRAALADADLDPDRGIFAPWNTRISCD